MSIIEHSQVQTDLRGLENSVLLEWRRHLVKDDPSRVWVVFCSAAFCMTVAWLLFHNVLLCAAALFMLASATSEYLLPISYRLTQTGASCRYGANRFEMEWDKVKRVLIYSDGVRLSPIAAPSRLDAYRGVFLRFAPDGLTGDRESLLAAIEGQRPALSCEEDA